jgi:hypothetical protein
MAAHDFNAPLPKDKKAKFDADAAIQNDPDTALVTVGDLLAQKPLERAHAAQERLQRAPRARLLRELKAAQERRQRVSAWLINCELTRRALPPAFRPLDINYDDAELLLDSLVVDLQWIGERYPEHRVYFMRWRKFTNPRYLDKQARYIFNSTGRGKRPIYKVVKGLAFTVDQQRECHYLRMDKFANQQAQLDRMLDEVRNEIEARYTMRLLDRGAEVVKLTNDELAMIRRRAMVWYCANLSAWSPTRTSRLYNAVTGANDPLGSMTKPINRQQALNVMQQLSRDLPKKVAKPW